MSKLNKQNRGKVIEGEQADSSGGEGELALGGKGLAQKGKNTHGHRQHVVIAGGGV